MTGDKSDTGETGDMGGSGGRGDGNGARARRPGRWVRLALAISLAFNLLVVGLAIGAALRMADPDRSFRAGPALGVAVVRELPRELRRDAFGRAREEFGARRKRLPEDLRAFIAILRAEPFDAAAAEEILGQQSENRARLERDLRERLVAGIAGMTASAREAYAARLEDAMERHGRRDGKRRKSGERR